MGYWLRKRIIHIVMYNARSKHPFFFGKGFFFSRALKRALYFTLLLTNCFFSSSVHLLLFLLSFFLNSVLSYFFFNSSFFITFESFSHIIFIY